MSLLDHPILVPAGTSAGAIRRALALTATLALVAVAILLPVMQSSDEAAQGYRIRTLDHQRTDLEAQIYLAQSDIARLGSLARTDGEARNRLGMVPATREVDVTVAEPMPDTHPIPNGYLPVAGPASPPVHTSLWTKLVHLLPFS
jgi:hypothetical protein